MSVTLNPYLSFRGDARAAMEFYTAVFGGDLTISSFREFGMTDGPDADNVMHGQLETVDGFTLMGSDVPSSMAFARGVNDASVSLSGDDDAKLRGWWAGLSEGATIELPLEAAPWGATFGQLVDRFGVKWVVNIAGATG